MAALDAALTGVQAVIHLAAAQHEAGKAYADMSRWGTMSLLNTARSGKFSSDRTIRQYCEDIWKLPPGNR